MRRSHPLLLGAALLAAACSRESRAVPAAASVTLAASTAPVVPAPLPAGPADAGPSAVPAATSVPIVASAAPAVVPAISDAGARSPSDCPEGMARVGRTCVDRWEAHLVTRDAAGEITPLPFWSRPPDDRRYEARSEAGAFPQAYISRVEAETACKNAGKRLCSMAEWQRACEGKRGTHYPYGASWQPERCNMDKPHLLSMRYGPSSKKWTYEAFNDPSLDREPGFLAPAGSFDQCVSDAGVFDLVGNLHEWVSDTVDEELIEKLEAQPVERKSQSWRSGNGVFMGGFFSTHEQLGPGCEYVTYAHEPSYHDYSTGFRCCAPAPAAHPPKRR